MSTFKRYLLFQIPGWVIAVLLAFALPHWLGIPAWAGWALCAAWVVKDFAVYPLVRDSYQGLGKAGAELLVGSIGVVETRLDPRGSVRVRGQRWGAQTDVTDRVIEAGEVVRVEGFRGLTLFVARVDVPASGSF